MTFDRRPPVRAYELDITGSIFGIKFIDGGAPNGLFELYIEDDEWWHYKLTANRVWLKDLQNVVGKAIAAPPASSEAEPE